MNTYMSVVLPVYNQFEKLDIVLKHFALQELDGTFYEIIVVDDGSTDKLSTVNKQFFKKNYNIPNLEIIHILNGGRANARNKGVDIAQGEFIVFCDGDRIPNRSFLLDYRNAILKHSIIVGGAMDYFGPAQLLHRINRDDVYEEISKFSRYPQYYKKAKELLFDGNGESCSIWSWLGFLVGNSCVQKQILLDVGGFSLDFAGWGFEHFDIAYRMLQAGYTLYNDCKIINFHLVHSRSTGFYRENILKSLEIMEDKYSINKKLLIEFFFDEKDKYNFKKLEVEFNEKD